MRATVYQVVANDPLLIVGAVLLSTLAVAYAIAEFLSRWLDRD